MQQSPTANTKTGRNSLQAWIVCLAASLFFFYEFIQLNLFNPIEPEIMATFHLNAAQTGQLASMYFYANALFVFPAGIIIDRFSTRLLIVLSLLICATATLVFGMTESYTIAAISRFMVGVGAAFCFLSCIRLASRWFDSHHLAFVTGIIVTMAMLGGLVAQTPLAWLSDKVGWRQAVFIDAILGYVIMVITWLAVRNRPPHSEADEAHDKEQLNAIGFWRSIGLAVSNRYNWFGGLYTSLLNLPVFLLGALWGMTYLTQVHHFSHMQSSYATTLFFLGVIFGSPAFGWFSDHLERRVAPMLVGAVISTVILFIIMFLPTLSMTSIMILFAALGFFTSSQILSYPAIAELNPSALTSTSVSIASLCIMISGAVFQPFFGWLMDLHWNHRVVNGIAIFTRENFHEAMWIMPIACILGFFIALLIKETFCEPQVD